jgi:hypothetical protein
MMKAIHIITILLSVLAIVFSAVCLAKKKENYIGYPFGPIDPSRVNIVDPQSVYGMPGMFFDITSPEQGYGADKSLFIAQAQGEVYRNMGIEWQLNEGFNNTGNATFDLGFANPPVYAWQSF